MQQTLGGSVDTQLVNVKEFGDRGVTMIGRGSDFGNQFKMKKDGGDYTREGCVIAFKDWWHAPEQSALRQRALDELKGEILGCHCLGKEGKYDSGGPIKTVKDEPSVCHGEVILTFINSQSEKSTSHG